ncbi:methyl-accepting chemotaxis protein [Desulfovibrio inopinatus]|uniref:methyl-accepting chemotaxis protein n=1 Tax=Desulfovibrio inopinatus TaxID=102109 RepID=UPI0012EC1C60|nr:methyl-accepting chemotaxis protein [Desulfovibrio inopinatus]
MQHQVSIVIIQGLVALGALASTIVSVVNQGVNIASIISLGVTLLAFFEIFIVHRVVFSPVHSVISLFKKDETRSISDIRVRIKEYIDEIQSLKLYAQQCKSDLDDFVQKADDAVHQAEAASQMAETSRIEGMMDAASRLESVVQRISMTSEHVSSHMARIMDGAYLQRDRLHETSVAMDEMNSAIGEVSHGAIEAAVSVEQAKGVAEDSAEVVVKSKNAITKVNDVALTLKRDMAQLGERAQMIDQVINLINDIADQTNLLALNAAIEAARAGEAGRGFAVVADEVRKLAEKTMSATREVSSSITAIQEAVAANVGLMDKTVELVNDASELAGRSGDAARDILLHAENNASKIADMAAATEEQTASAAGITKR